MFYFLIPSLSIPGYSNSFRNQIVYFNALFLPAWFSTSVVPLYERHFCLTFHRAYWEQYISCITFVFHFKPLKGKLHSTPLRLSVLSQVHAGLESSFTQLLRQSPAFSIAQAVSSPTAQSPFEQFLSFTLWTDFFFFLTQGTLTMVVLNLTTALQ